MQRLHKGRELEQERDIKEVQRDLSLIQSPAVGMKKHKQEDTVTENTQESDHEMELIEDGGEIIL
ncbi:hypothetical protein NQ314_012405 [Rhamnusium bicolor]|uniref:Uncharacterized protein n=1 Tax=Rhamnusium bicolor TaxID=1586634 RepID=A0AAV8XCI9_9CUCU|nr:hypothetical protein NQ314_012405 [Rhamnusium bicolor]